MGWDFVRRGPNDAHQALHKLSVKTVTWAAQEEEELARAPQESAQPLAGEEHVAGVDHNDESHDVEVGSDAHLSDEGGGIHGSEAEDIAFTREVRAVRRIKRQGRRRLGVSGTQADSSLWRNT